MSVIYDTITNDIDLIQYVNNAADTTLYNDSNAINIFNSLWLPRIYGKDLTAFEIASSGKIAITINDIHSFDLQNTYYQTPSNIVTSLNTRSNYGFDIQVNNGDVKLFLNSFSNDASLHAASNVSIDTTTGNINTYSATDTFFVANSNLNISANYGNYQMYANNSNVSFVTDNINSNYTLYSSSNANISSCNSLFINATDYIGLSTNNLNILTSDMSYTALSNLNFYISSSSNNPSDPIFTVGRNYVKVRGDMIITGSIETSNILNTTVVQETLKVSDKVILLASIGDGSSNDTLPLDGLNTNDGSRIQIDGFPQSVNSNLYSMHEKFIKWNYNVNGTVDLGTSNATTESFWDLQGGSFRLSVPRNYGDSSNPIIKDLSFGLRINHNDELELFKKFYNTATSNFIYKRLSIWGRIL